jgi:protein gp37
MGADTHVQWAHDSLNLWFGCEKVSPGCKVCYAENDTPVRVLRHRGLALWGPGSVRYETKSWQANLASFVREAGRTGPRRVFVESEGDFF